MVNDPHILIDILHGQLVVGNHESITLFGFQEQQTLNIFSKRLTGVYSTVNSEAEDNVRELLGQIEAFYFHMENRNYNCKDPERNRLLKMEYQTILQYLERTLNVLKLQETELLKEQSILLQLQGLIISCISGLEKCIETGKQVLDTVDENGSIDEEVLWKLRLQNRIEDLKISLEVASQNEKLVFVLSENTREVLDRIKHFIIDVIPYWKKQVKTLISLNDFIEASGQKNGQELIDELIELHSLEQRNNSLYETVKTF